MPYFIENLLHIENSDNCFVSFDEINGYVIYGRMILMVKIFNLDRSNDSNNFAMELRREILMGFVGFLGSLPVFGIIIIVAFFHWLGKYLFSIFNRCSMVYLSPFIIVKYIIMSRPGVFRLASFRTIFQTSLERK